MAKSFANAQAREIARHLIAPTAVCRSSDFSQSLLGFGGCASAFALGLSPIFIILFKIPAILQATVTFTSPHISVCYLPEQGIYLTFRFGRLMVKGLSPSRIRSFLR